MATADKDAAPKAAKPKTVAMTRDKPEHPGGPTTAAVHPQEVERMKQSGWIEA